MHVATTPFSFPYIAIFHSYSPFPVPPTITVPPMDVAVREGLSAEFTCSARGIPSPEITWFHGDAQVGVGMSLIVDNANTNDQGDYVCLASNSAGETRASATLTVFGELKTLHAYAPLCTSTRGYQGIYILYQTRSENLH